MIQPYDSQTNKKFFFCIWILIKTALYYFGFNELLRQVLCSLPHTLTHIMWLLKQHTTYNKLAAVCGYFHLFFVNKIKWIQWNSVEILQTMTMTLLKSNILHILYACFRTYFAECLQYEL